MLKQLLLSLSLLFAFTSCQQDADGEGSEKKSYTGTLAESTGGKLDVIVVADEPLWQGIAGNTFRKYFTKTQAGLPQAEPIFNVRQVEENQVNTILRRSRNLVYLKIGKEEFSVEKNRFARPQLVARLTAPDSFRLAKLIAKNHEELVRVMRSSEVNYLQKQLIRRPQPVPQTLKDRNVSMRIPRDFELENDEDDLLVFWKKGLKSDQGIIIHFEPLDADDALIGNRIIPLRDSLTKKYIPGEREGSYMQVETYIPPTFENVELDGHFTIQTRGLWRTEGDFMGGSFINYSIFDEDHNRRIMLDGFVYAPQLNKRDILLELEAILRTFETTN